MHDKQNTQFGFVQSAFPWMVATGALIVYLATLIPWLTLANLAFVAKVTGLDWSPPLTSPLFFFLTYPIRVMPAAWQPMLLNGFAALCSAVTLGLLVRSVALLPHDRTHAQRLRERSEYSVLTIPLAWIPPLFAALVCGLQMTFWEHSIAATGESLNLLVFAYVIRCLLEFRVDQNESWLRRFAFVYGLGVTNNWAMIGFFPCFLIAILWIRGIGLLQFRTFLTILACGLAGLLLYFFLPLLWLWSDASGAGFWETFRAQIANQKAFLLGEGLRSRALILSLTSILPILIIGIRWPSSFGDTSAAGAVLTNAMFRIIHIVFLSVCLWVAFDQKFSPRALGRSIGVPFLTFYYLGALSVGYFSGYLLLIFGESKMKTSRRRSSGNPALSRVISGLVLLAFVGVPAGLIARNFKTIWNQKQPLLEQFAESAATALPAEGAFVLSDDFYGSDLLVLQAYLQKNGNGDQHVLVHTRSLTVPEYHRRLAKRFPNRFPNTLEGEATGESVEDAALLKLMLDLSRSNKIFYLHPSFGFYFERFFSEPHGLVQELKRYGTNQVLPPAPSAQETDANQQFWTSHEASLKTVQALSEAEFNDALFLSRYYSRALNHWGVEVQRSKRLVDAAKWFQAAVNLNTNNQPAIVNLGYNRILRNPEISAPPTPRTAEERFGIYRDWETLLGYNGPFDHPDYLLQLGEILSQQGLYRQAAIDLDRAVALESTNLLARFALATNYLQGGLPDRALEVASEIRNSNLFTVNADTETGLFRLEASAQYSKSNLAESERILVDGALKYTNRTEILDALVMFYGQTKRYSNALDTIERILTISNDDPQALINQATIHFNTQTYQKALESLDRVLRKDAENVLALLYKVFILIETKDHANALAEVEKILAFSKEKPEALLYKGVILIQKKDYTGAIKPLNRVLELQPDNLNALQNLAIANLQLGNLEEAKRDYLRLQGMRPTDFEPYYFLGEIAYKKKSTDEAIKFYEYYLKYSDAPELPPELLAERNLVSGRLAELKRTRK